jgi:hypothetical protein
MSDLDDRHCPRLLIHALDDPVVTLTDSVPLLPGEFLAAGGARVADQPSGPDDHPCETGR